LPTNGTGIIENKRKRSLSSILSNDDELDIDRRQGSHGKKLVTLDLDNFIINRDIVREVREGNETLNNNNNNNNNNNINSNK
jgi:hypothetical protein